MRARKAAAATPPLCDTREGIEASLGSLETFRALTQERTRRGYDDDETLTEFVVFGYLWLDTVGNLSVAQERVAGLRPVVTRGEFWKHVGKDGQTTCSFRAIPDGASRCPTCGHGWTIQTLWDSYARGEEFFHILCAQRASTKRVHLGYQAALVAAGFLEGVPGEAMVASKNTILYTGVEVPNEYWPPSLPRVFASWLQVRTAYGVFRIGDRKRVTEVSWADIELVDLFPTSTSTHAPGYVHCWSDADLIDVLRGLHAYLSKRKVP